MSEEKEDPREDPADEETAVSLPERDAMTIIAGPGGSLAPVDGGIAVDPTSPETGTDKLLPPPQYET